MTLREIKEVLDAEVLVGHDRLDIDVKEGGCSDLVTEIPIYGKAGILLLTGLTTPRMIQAAHDLGVAAVMTVRGKRPPLETIRLAEELDIPLFATNYILYEAVGRLHVRGLPGCMKKVGDR
jgi:predicted transcriptional regulator